MARESVNEESSRADRVFKLAVPPSAAEAVRRCLAAEQVRSGPSELLLRVYLDLPGGALGLAALRSPRDCAKISATRESSGLWRLELKEERGPLTHRTYTRVRQEHLRFALGQAGRELIPALPARLTPAFACTFARTQHAHPAGWTVTEDADLCIHLLDEQWLARPTQLGPCIARQRNTLFCVQHEPSELPAWLAQLKAERAEPYSRFARGTEYVRAYAPEQDGWALAR